MEFIDPNDIWKLKDIVLSKVSIVEIAKEYGVRIEEKNTGDFTHRAYCPFHVGKGNEGQERTPSMFFSNTTNSFCCFGCSRGGGILDFIMYMDGTPSSIALEKLAKKIGIIDKDGHYDELLLDSLRDKIDIFDPNKTIDPYIFEISTILRNYIQRFNDQEIDKELRWMERVGAKVDTHLAKIGYEDWEYAKDLSEKVKKAVKDRLYKNSIK